MSEEQTTALTPVQEVRGTLKAMLPQFEMVLPAHVTKERFFRVAMTAVMNEPKLLNCNRNSLYSACMKAATDGLILDGREAAIVPYKEDAVYMRMVAGLCKLIRNSGEVAKIGAHVVRENDDYDAWTDEDGDHFKFRKARGERGKIVLTFAYAVMKDGGAPFHEEMDEDQMDAVRKMSKGKNTPWNGPFVDEMRKKSVIRRMSKYMPMSTDINWEDHDQFHTLPGKEDAATETAPSAPSTGPTRLAGAMGVQTERVQETPPVGADAVDTASTPVEDAKPPAEAKKPPAESQGSGEGGMAPPAEDDWGDEGDDRPPLREPQEGDIL